MIQLSHTLYSPPYSNTSAGFSFTNNSPGINLTRVATIIDPNPTENAATSTPWTKIDTVAKIMSTLANSIDTGYLQI